MQLLNTQIKSTLNDLIINFKNISNYKKIKIFIILYINSIIQEDMVNFQISQLIAISKHRSKCSNITCLCKTDIIDFQKTSFTKLILNKIHKNNVRSKNKLQQIKTSDILFYVASLYQLGFTVLAFQQVINLIDDKKPQKWMRDAPNDALLSSSHTLKSYQSDSQRILVQQKHDLSKKVISHRKFNKTALEDARLSLLQSDISQQLKEDFMKKSDQSEIQISEAVNLFIQSELGQATLKAQIISLLQQKIELFQLLLGEYTSTILYNKAKAISQNFVKVEDDLIKQYERFPSYKLQAVICFLQAEIYNDYLKAYKYANFTTISDEKLINMRKNLKLNLFSNKITYINVRLTDNLEALEIQSLSNNSHIFFGYEYEEFRKHQYLNFLIPDAVVNEHGLMIKQFIQNGTTKFFRNQSLNYFKLQNQFIQPFSMLFDIDNYASNGIQFALFCQQIDQAAAHILLDINLMVAGISMNLFEKIGYKSKQINDNSEIILESYKISIYEIIPNFDEVLENQLQNKVSKSKSSQKYYNLKINLIDVLRQVSQSKANSSGFNQYDATLSIHQRQIYGLFYYIIEIDDLRENVIYVKSSILAMNQNVDIKLSNSIDDLPKINDSIDEASVRLPEDLQKKLFIKAYNNTKQAEQQSEQKQYILNASILSPIQSSRLNQSKLVNPAQEEAIVQQKFFNLEIQKDDNKSITIPQIGKYDIQDKAHNVDRNMEQFIQNQLNQNKENKFIDDQGSQVSSLAGVRKSAYFKKYDVIQTTILRGKMPRSFIYCISQIMAFILISSAYNALIIQQNSVDLNKFVQYVDMLRFNQYFMAPFGMFTSARTMWIDYPADLSGKKITKAVYDLVYPWMQTTFMQQFQVMKSNFQIQFQNPYLQEFFIDDYIKVYYQQTSPSNLTFVNMTFKETLFQFLNYQYTYRIGYAQGKPTDKMPVQTYNWVNFFILTNHFESLTDDILVYTQNAKDAISKKWWVQASVFIFVTGITVIMGFLFYLSFLSNYDSYIEIFSCTDTQSILKDIDRYKIFLNLLAKDSDIIFRYVFELEVKEQFIITYQNQQKSVNFNYKITKKQKSQQQYKLPYLNNLIIFICIFALFSTLTHIITFQTQIYLQKYSSTMTFYKQMADLDTRICGIYGDKLVTNDLLQFVYYNRQNQTNFGYRILQSTQIIANFSAMAYDIETTNYLFSTEFSDQFSAAKTGSICALLSPTDLAYAGQFCVLAFDGSLLLGLSNSLNFIINELVTEYTVNQFRVKVLGTNTFSIQGCYILSRVLESLIQQLKTSIVVSTNSQLSTVQSFCVSYLVYAFVFMIVLSYFVIKYYQDEYYYTKRFVLLIPSQTLLLNDNLERQLRIYIARDAQ